MKLEGLEAVHRKMQAADVRQIAFDYNLSGKFFRGLFSSEIAPFELALCPVGVESEDAFILLFQVDDYFEASSFVDFAVYRKLAKFLLTTGASGNKLVMHEFLSDVDKYCERANIEIRQASEKQIIQARSDLEERDKPYFSHFRRNSIAGHHVTKENLNKTLLLKGRDAYLFSRKHNVSFVYSSNPEQAKNWRELI